MNTKISVTNKLKYLRKTWKKAHCHQQPTEIPEQEFPTDMGDHDFSSQDHGWMGPTNDLQTSQGGSVLDDQTGIDIGAELGYQSWETNDQLLTKQNYAESNHNAYINNAKSILGQCSFQKSFHSEKIAEVEPKSFELYLKIGELVLTLDNHSRELLSSVLQLALEEHFKSHHRDPKFLEYPTTEKQFQSEYLNPNNSNALVNKIPIPVVETLDGGGHSYTNWVTMIDYISSTTENSKKTRKAVKKRHRSLKHSKRFKDHLDKCESFMSDLERNMVVMVLFWSDGFDPNRTKTNRGSVWALTATYIFYDCTQKEVVMVKTEIVSAGRDKDDHSSVFQRMAEDLDGLQSKDNLSEPISIEAKSLFFKGQKVRCFPIIMGALMDNPERRWNCGLKMGSSNNHGYFGLSCNFSQLQVPFAACHTCKIRIEEYVKTADWSKPCLDGGQPCPRCLGFSTSKLVEDGVYREPLFQPNPLDSQMLQNASTPPGLALSRKPGFLSCKLLMEGWNFAKDRFVKAEWTAAVTKSYLGDVLCINDYQIQRFLKEARQVMDPETAEEQKKYLCLPPGLWSLLELEDLYECIMHQAMNAGKALAKMMHRWTTSNGRTTTAIKAASPLLEKVKCLRLSRFRAMTYKTEKMGGYVAEDWKTWVMLGPWLYRNLTDSSMSPLRVEVPD